MNPVFGLDDDFARSHVPALLLLGALRIGELVRSTLPPPGTAPVGMADPPPPFLALLLGVVSVDTRLRALVPPPEVRDSPPDEPLGDGLLR